MYQPDKMEGERKGGKEREKWGKGGGEAGRKGITLEGKR